MIHVPLTSWARAARGSTKMAMNSRTTPRRRWIDMDLLGVKAETGACCSTRLSGSGLLAGFVVALAVLTSACAGEAPEGSAERAGSPASVDTGAGAVRPGRDPALDAWLARVDSSVLTRWGACPFECCIYRDWIAEGPVVVRTEPRSGASVVATLPAGARFEADTGFVRITGIQLVVVSRPVEAWVHQPGRRDGGRPDTIPAGDTLLVLEHLGEG